MSAMGRVYDDLENIVAKLFVLRDSCKGILHTDKSNPNLIWFQGAEAILAESVDGLQQALHSIEAGAEETGAGSAEVVEERSSEDIVEKTSSEDAEEETAGDEDE